MTLLENDPRAIGGYLLEDRLGAGGMGVVYRARSVSGRKVAVKVIRPELAADAEFRARFRQEVTAARKVSGAFTAPVLDADADAPAPWLTTLFIAGPSLGERVSGQGPLTPPEVRRLAAGLAEALREIHRVGLVHRDLKPGNVLLAEDGPRVIDFGIAKRPARPSSPAPEWPSAPRRSWRPSSSATARRRRPRTCSPSARCSPSRPPGAARSARTPRTRWASGSSTRSRT
ncbi:serine/threonine-protein kinase [Kitasatospora sp. NPDC017646]|uniref:serine/threonine-protein kinase n=1 Tax=Kitasatospora sp. NPDC017646 TaxID=3364024 RepID=UPI0037A37151